MQYFVQRGTPVRYLVISFFSLVNIYEASSQIKVENSATVVRPWAGEIQSTVIPPSNQFPKGSVLITIDGLHPPTPGAVIKFDLSNPTTPINATFDNVPNSTDYMFGTNDHDILTLPNGDVLYITGAFSKRPLNPKPAWFDSTFRDIDGPGTFGPGARYVVLTWRSTDGGSSFKYLSEMDAATISNGVPAYPQFVLDSNKVRVEVSPWDMGGSDGQYAKLLSGTDKVYLTFGIVGYNPKKNTGSKFVPDPNNKIEKTLLLSSTGATSWTVEGMMDGHMWRTDIVPVKEKLGSQLVFSGFFKDGGIIIGKKSGNQPYQFNTPLYSGKDFQRIGRVSGPLNKYIKTNLVASTVMARVPNSGNQMVVVYPGAAFSTNACRMFFFNTETNEFNEADLIIPEDKTATGFILHPTIIDPGNNSPLLLYWYDLNGKTLRAKIKGRIITGDGSYTDDFIISKFSSDNFRLTVPFFNVKETEERWYGDYHTAGGFTVQRRGLEEKGVTTRTTNFFPVWVQPGNRISYGKVSFTWSNKKLAKIPFHEIELAVKEIPPKNWVKPTTVDFRKLNPARNIPVNRQDVNKKIAIPQRTRN